VEKRISRRRVIKKTTEKRGGEEEKKEYKKKLLFASLNIGRVFCRGKGREGNNSGRAFRRKRRMKSVVRLCPKIKRKRCDLEIRKKRDTKGVANGRLRNRRT